MDIAQFRSEFPITASRAFLYNGAFAPAARNVRAAMDDWCEKWSLDPNASYNQVTEDHEALRSSFATLIGAERSAVALTDSTSRGANMAIRHLATRPGSNVVIDDTTYPSSAYPWLTATGHELRRVFSTTSADPTVALAEAIDDQTVALCVSHVAPETGWRHNLGTLAKLARTHNSLLIVDAAQTTGALPIDVKADGIDVLFTTAMKWLLGPPGLGFLYVRPELIKHGPPTEVGYMGVDLPMSEDWPMTTLPPLFEDARRFEIGLPNLAALAPARAGIELLQRVGIEQVANRIAELVERCLHGLEDRAVSVRTPLERTRRAGVIAFEHPDAERLASFARERCVDIGGYPWGVVRVDPHAFNDEAEIDRFLSVFDEFERAR